MERANANSTGGRKRTRDQGDVDKEARKGKKPEISKPSPKDQKHHDHQLCEGFGVFDFPWLKEGVVFKAEEYFDLESTFPGVFSANFDQCCEENNTTLVGGMSSCYREEKKCEDDGVWSFGDHDQIDGFEPIDRILSLVIDQPAAAIDHIVGLNKA